MFLFDFPEFFFSACNLNQKIRLLAVLSAPPFSMRNPQAVMPRPLQDEGVLVEFAHVLNFPVRIEPLARRAACALLPAFGTTLMGAPLPPTRDHVHQNVFPSCVAWLQKFVGENRTKHSVPLVRPE